ncbi:MAG: AAA family ATPase [Actinomycetota bacterium]|nr:AAA family ATPase [Actinomycetota bacterium]
MTILIEADATLVEAMRFALGPEVLVADSVPSAIRALEDHPRELLLVVGPDTELGAALQLAEDMRMSRPEVGVVLTRRRVDVSTLAQALRSGVREVVSPDNLPELGQACRRSIEVSQRMLGLSSTTEQQSTGRIVTVFAAKGGCGKTTFATNIGVSLAEGGRRRVCIVDLDLAFGDVAIAMQLMPSRTITDAVAMQGSMDATGVEPLLTPHSPGVQAVLAPLEPGEAERIPAATVAELLRTLRGMFDYVVVDTPPAFTEQVLAAFDVSDSYVLLATLDIPALKNLKLTLDMLDLLGYPRENWHVVLNRSDSKVGLAVADVEKTLKVPIAAQVPSSRAVSASINKGVPLVLDEPGHPVSNAIRGLALGRIAVQHGRSGQAAATHDEGSRNRRALSFLRRGGSA